ncbi:MAG TPA: heme-binding domain-containing protein [Bacteroidota bacterium]|nr:heme-binding domain-containing protein [Bacteroidota bacterium]
MKTKIRSFFLGLLVVFALMQTVQPERTNPDDGIAMKAPAEVQAVLKRACYDCHSNDTRWPWYSYVAPVSWFLSKHVVEGREHLNFSRWEAMDDRTRMHAASEIIEVLQSGEMPLSSYLLLHGEAELSTQDKQLLTEWARGWE